MVVLGDVLIGLFVALWLTAASSLLWALVFAIRMTFQSQSRGVAYSKATLWNPMNAMFQPSLLSDAGRRSRTRALRGLLVFLVAFAVLGCFGLVVKLYE